MKESPYPQGTDQWRQARLGKITASNAGKVIGYNKKTRVWELKDTDTARDYKYKVAAERLLNQGMEDEYVSKWMRRGIEMEPYAREAFIQKYKIPIRQLGFITTDDEKIGASLDGLSWDNKILIEIKVPAHWTMLRYLDKGHDDDYILQVMTQLLVSGAQEAHFLAWHETWPNYRVVYQRDPLLIGTIEKLLYRVAAQIDEIEQVAIQKGCIPVGRAAE